MPTLTAGQSQDLILQPNDQYTVTIGANSEAYIDLGAGTGGSGYDSVRLISGGTNTYTVGEYGAVARVKIRCVSGTVNYVYGAGSGVVGGEQEVSETLLPRLRGLPLLRAPKDITGLNVIGAGVTQQIVTRNGRRAWEITLPATPGGNFTAWFPLPTGTYNHKVQAEIEIEDAMQFNGGSVQLNICESNAFTQARRYINSINSAAGWNGIHQLAASDADWITVGSATWATISAAPSPAAQIKFLLSASANKPSKVWIYEVVKDEKDNLPMIILGADDGHITWYNDGLPILEKYGLRSYLAYIADPVGTPNYMTMANWQDSVARGHEVIVHGCKAGYNNLREWMTNPAPYATGLEAVIAEIQYNRDSMIANGLDPSGIGRKCYIYPQGFHQPSGVAGDTTVITALKNLGFELGRLAAKNGGFTIQPSLGATIFHLPILGHWYSAVDETANINAIIASINTEIAEGRSVILMFHIVRAVPTVAEDISPANLDKLCAAIAAQINAGKAVNAVFADLLNRMKSLAFKS